jgi:hypothetical protein
MLKLVLGGVALALVAVLGLAAARPDTLRVQRTALIKAPPDRIFPLIDSLRRGEEWSPYYRKDPAMTGEYRGPERGKGAVFEFAGNREVGKGRVTITDTAPPERVTMRLEMREPFTADNVVEFTLVPRGDATDVTWAMRGTMPYMAKVVHLFLDMDRMVGRDFEAGLANLKAIAEG